MKSSTHSLSVVVLFVLFSTVRGTWAPAGTAYSGVLQGVSTLPNGNALVAGGVNDVGNGIFMLEKNNSLSLKMSITKCKICVMEVVKMHPDGLHGVAGGVAFLGEPVTYSTSDGGNSWLPSADIAKGFNGAVSGHDIELLPTSKKGEYAWAFISEFNSWQNGTVCTHGKVSAQCSGILISIDNGETYKNIDWSGTDGPDTDAMAGAFPTEDVWYIAGGLVSPESDPPGPAFKATIMKTEDAGQTFKTVFNKTAPQSHPGRGVGGMTDISCANKDVCYAATSCFEDNCEPLYGSFLFKTENGGKTWKQIGNLFYEVIINVVEAMSEDEVILAGGGVSLFDKGHVWHTTNSGVSWKNSSLSVGQVTSLDMLPDGSAGHLAVLNAASSVSSLFRYSKD